MNEFLLLMLIRGWSVALGSLENASHERLCTLVAVRDEEHILVRGGSRNDVLRAAASMALRVDRENESEAALYGEEREPEESGF